MPACLSAAADLLKEIDMIAEKIFPSPSPSQSVGGKESECSRADFASGRQSKSFI